MSYIEQLFYTRPQPQSRAPYRTDRRAAPERSPNDGKAQISLPRREAGQEAPNAPRWYVSISAMVMFLLSKMRDELAIRRAMAELRDLDDRMLRDIGLSRCDIASIRRRET
ncbi:DUF1127 domain-containing protein [Bradyrhizobium cenepequi]